MLLQPEAPPLDHRLSKPYHIRGASYESISCRPQNRQQANDPKRIEASCFAEIDMGDPFIEEICLMTDELTDLLRRMELDTTQPLASYLIAA
jgi:hypothetical protein